MAKERLILNIDEKLHEKLKAEAEKLGIPMTNLVSMLIASYFDGLKFERDRTEAELSKVKYTGRG